MVSCIFNRHTTSVLYNMPNSTISYFNNLKYLNINDHIYLDYNNKTYNYKITNIYDVEKTGSLNIKRNNNKSTITLITCRDNSNKQIVIIGEIEFVN